MNRTFRSRHTVVTTVLIRPSVGRSAGRQSDPLTADLPIADALTADRRPAVQNKNRNDSCV